jgi:hypothetical protein
MTAWVVTSEELRNYSFLIGVYDSQAKAQAAAMQYLKDYGFTDTYYEEGERSEWWSDKYSDSAVVIERTQIV